MTADAPGLLGFKILYMLLVLPALLGNLFGIELFPINEVRIEGFFWEF